MTVKLVETKGTTSDINLVLDTRAQFMEISPEDGKRYVIGFADFLSDTQYEVVFNMEQAGVSAEVVFLYHLKEGQSLSLKSTVVHVAANTSFSTKARGVLENNAMSDFVGKIIIKATGHNTVSYLKHAILVTGENTKSKSQPILEIDANDVKASHGATTGRINAEQLYFLQSRGLSDSEAKEIVIEGFLSL